MVRGLKGDGAVCG